MARMTMLTLATALWAGCGAAGGRTGGADLAAPGGGADLAGASGDLAMTGGNDDLGPASACNNLTLAGAPVVQIDYVASGAPTFTGGTLVDGTYFIMSGAFYTGAGGMTGPYGSFQGVYRLSGTTLDLFVSSPKGVQSITATVTTSNNNITLSPTCGAMGLSQELYTSSSTASGTTLSLGMITGSIGAQLTLTKQ